MSFLMITFVVSGLFLAAVCVPLMLDRIPPNGLYGFRLKKTMENPDIWYPVNRYSGRRLFLASLLLVLAAVGFAQIPGITMDVYSYAVLATWLVLFALAIVSSIRYMNSL
jgi:hypothetical protein